jgi:hypothetical protein
MKAIADCLTQTGISYPLVQLRTLFQKFLGLSQGFFSDERNATQMLEPRLDGSLYPGIPFSMWEGDAELNHNQVLFSGAESFSSMLEIADEAFLPYGDSL